MVTLTPRSSVKGTLFHTRFAMLGAGALALFIGQSCQRTSAANTTNGRFRQVWYVPQVGYGQARPTIVGGAAVFATGNGELVARMSATGKILWSQQIAAEQISGGNLIARAGAIIAPISYTTIAVNATTGKILWSYSAPIDSLNSSGRSLAPGYVAGARIDADDATVFIPAWGASLSAVDVRSGRPRWVWRDTVSEFRSGAVGARVSGDTVFVSCWRFLDTQGLQSVPFVVALDRVTGRELWQVVLPGKSGGVVTNGAPAIWENLVIIAVRGGDAWSIDRTSHDVVWHYQAQTKTGTIAEAEVMDDVVYIDGGDGNAYALRAKDGSVIWHAEFQGLAIADLLVTPRAVYLANGPTLSAFDRTTGHLLARSNAPLSAGHIAVVGSAAVAADGRIFLTVSDGAWCVLEP